MKVMTVCGEIPVEQLGVTQMHEHVLINTDFDGNDYNLRLDDPDIAAGELTHYKNAGGQSMVDLTCPGIGRDVRGLQRISETTGVHIIAATGFYRECSYPDYVHRETADQLAARLIRDVREGMDDTEIRAGILGEIAGEYGRGNHLSPGEEKVFTAVAYAQRETGLPVSTHCWAGETAFAQIDVLTRHGVPPEKIIIGHLAVEPAAWEHVLAVADRGVCLGIDCIGYWYEKVVPLKDPERARWVCELIKRGFLNRITLSQDLARKLQQKHYHGAGYECLLRQFLPLLRETGVTETEIQTLLVDNPRRILAG